jgi:pilus assembly protein CpaE
MARDAGSAMKTQAIVVADDPVYVNWLQNAAGNGTDFSLIRPHDAEDLIERVQAMGRIDMVFVQFDAANLDSRLSMIERLLERLPEIPVAGLGADNNPDVVLAAMRSGARDFFVLRRDEANVAALLGKLLRRTTAAARIHQKQGMMLAVVSGHPHESTAFVAEHLALACAERLPKTDRVLLVDVATPAGAAAIFLNINQSYSVLDAINDVYRCDQTLVDTAFSKHASGVFLLSLPEDLVGRPQINVEELVKLLVVLRSLFACVVVATDGHLPVEGLTGIIAQADRTLMISDQSIIKSRHSKYLLRALRLEDCPLDRTGLLVDNYRRRLGLEPENLAEILDLPLSGTISASTGAARIQAMNSGEPMFTVAPKDPFCADVRRLAGALIAGEAKAKAPSPGLIDRLFG